MDPRGPIPTIVEAHQRALDTMPFDDTEDFELATRGFIAAPESGVIRADDGRVVWDDESYGFIDGDAPLTVHPSLWRQSRLTRLSGLYELVDGIYQVRGFDLSHITFVEGDTGTIVIDPLISTETAAAALTLYRQHRGDRPITAVIYTHSHADHFGGVKGVISQDDVDAGRVQVIAPKHFVTHAVAENVFAGTAMARRAGYMYGAALARGPMGQVGGGLGQTTSTGTVSLIAPTLEIATTGERHTIDGIEMEFQMAPGSEAPAEMHVFFPRFSALCIAENANHTLHNILTLRGALVRDPNAWAKYLTEAIELFGSRMDMVFGPHHWPAWGREAAVEFLGTQRDLYAYLHDQTLRMLNQGYTGSEIAERIELPPALEDAWNARGYYGSVSHNVKAIYQRYMGWFDGNPARLWQHTPQNGARRYVAAMGGVDRVLELASAASAEGDLRWAATLLDHAVFAEPDHEGARSRLADTLEQLGYGSENATWRNFFLSGATELRGANFGTPGTTASADLVAQLSAEQFFDALAIQIDGPRAWDLSLAIDCTFTDTGDNYRLTLRNGVLVNVKKPASDDADATMSLATTLLPLVATGAIEAAMQRGLTVTGDAGALQQLLSVLDPGNPAFDIVTP